MLLRRVQPDVRKSSRSRKPTSNFHSLGSAFVLHSNHKHKEPTTVRDKDPPIPSPHISQPEITPQHSPVIVEPTAEQKRAIIRQIFDDESEDDNADEQVCLISGHVTGSPPALDVFVESQQDVLATSGACEPVAVFDTTEVQADPSGDDTHMLSHEPQLLSSEPPADDDSSLHEAPPLLSLASALVGHWDPTNT
jgi:hypothetical protein